MSRRRKDKNTANHLEPFWLIGLYTRLSREDDNEDESESVINSEKILRDFTAEYFDAGTYKIVHVFIDDGLTGTDTSRPEYQKMKKCIETKEINCVIFKSLSRGFRNLGDQTKFIDEFIPTHGARFINMSSPFIDTYRDPRSATTIEIPIRGIFNEQFAAQTSEEIRKTFDMKRKRGDFIGAFAPYGYIKNPVNKNHLLIDEEVAPVIRDIFHWRANEGMSRLGIAKKLNKLGTLSPTAYKKKKGFNYNTPYKNNDGLWSDITIREILRNEMYIGTMVQGKERVISYKVHTKIRTDEKDWYRVENTHEAIIDRDLFDKVQTLNEHDTRTAPGNDIVYLFSGFIRCADCDRAMRRKSSKRKKQDGSVAKYTSYTCSTRANKGVQFCNANSIPEKLIYDIVLKAIKSQIAFITNMSYIIDEINKKSDIQTQSSRLESQLIAKHKELESTTQMIDSLYPDWKTGIITQADYQRMKANFEKNVVRTKDIITNIENEIQSFSKGIGKDSPYLQAFIKHENIQSLDRNLLTELIDTIHIGENKEVTITFRFHNQQQDILEFIENNRDRLPS